MSTGMILDILTQNRVMLIEAAAGNVMNCIVVYTLFGKRKYDWFFPAACAVRYVFYNIGLLSIWNAMYGTQSWYKITMSTCATATALGLVVITAILWKEPLCKVLTGVFATECINDGILYQIMGMKISIIQECLLLTVIFTVLYFIVRPLLKKYRTYIIKQEVICLTLVFTFFLVGWVSNLLYNTSASLRQKPMFLLGSSVLIGGGSALTIAFVIHTRNIFRKKKELKQKKKQMENYYEELQNQIKELDNFKEIIEGALDELTNQNKNLSQKEKKKQIRQYIENLEERYQNLNQLFFCEDVLIDGILADFAIYCKKQNIEADILFQNYHRGNISREDSVSILLKLVSYAKQAAKVKLHAAAIKNQLVYSVELQEKVIAESKAVSKEKSAAEKSEKLILQNEIKVSPKAFKKYVKKYDGGLSIERENGKIRIILGLKR